jgi:hypothetical protein
MRRQEGASSPRPPLYLFGRASSKYKIPGRVVQKSTGGMLHSIPEPVELVGNAFG